MRINHLAHLGYIKVFGEVAQGPVELELRRDYAREILFAREPSHFRDASSKWFEIEPITLPNYVTNREALDRDAKLIKTAYLFRRHLDDRRTVMSTAFEKALLNEPVHGLSKRRATDIETSCYLRLYHPHALGNHSAQDARTQMSVRLFRNRKPIDIAIKHRFHVPTPGALINPYHQSVDIVTLTR